MQYVNEVQFRKATRGWLCEIAFRAETRRQSTMEDHRVRGYGFHLMRGYRHFVALRDGLGMLCAFVDAYRNMRDVSKTLQTEPGEHELWKDPA